MDKIEKINIDFDQTKPIVCEECGNDGFVGGFLVREIPGLLVGKLEPEISTIPTLVCSKCGHVNKRFRPEEENEEDKKVESSIIMQ